ncbi:MAG: hypothetical protein AAFU77_14360 [Myxococcota bacterium]
MRYLRLANDLFDELESDLADEDRYFVVEHIARAVENSVAQDVKRRGIDFAIAQVQALADPSPDDPQAHAYARAQQELLGRLQNLRAELA